MTGPLVKVMRVAGADPSVALPTYQTSQAAGADIRANLNANDRASGLVLASMARVLVPTGLRAEIPPGYEMQIRARSGLALKKGLSLPNAPGTIDSDYRGEIGVILVNLSDQPVTIGHGERIAQIIVAPVVQAQFELSETLADTTRGQGGFGSTGVV